HARPGDRVGRRVEGAAGETSIRRRRDNCGGHNQFCTDYSLSRYSRGTSSTSTSCVRTSLGSSLSAFSTPATTAASNALPSSSNSTTLSESAVSRLDKPCKSPDCPPSLAVGPFAGNPTVSAGSLVSRMVSRRVIFNFLPATFLCAALTAGFFFEIFPLRAIFFLPATFLCAALPADFFFEIFPLRAIFFLPATFLCAALLADLFFEIF